MKKRKEYVDFTAPVIEKTKLIDKFKSVDTVTVVAGAQGFLMIGYYDHYVSVHLSQCSISLYSNCLVIVFSRNNLRVKIKIAAVPKASLIYAMQF